MAAFSERLALAPMMDVTDAYFRRLLRIMTKKTVLYTEMVVDDTVNHTNNIDFFIGKHPDIYPSVIQLGGSNPETLGKAAEVCGQYDEGYAEINLNCGCPSNRVAKRCFGAQLMLQPELVRQIVSTMVRRSAVPISVKCRLGVTGERDTYEDLVEFITSAHSGGANKFIIHSRDCILDGLTTKQNRAIPPLRYDVVHRLSREFPDLTFILNGGISTFKAAKEHFTGEDHGFSRGCDTSALPAVHGVMIGRSVAADPVLFATADSEFWGLTDPCNSRRSLLEQYCDYCDHIQSDSGPRRTTIDGKVQQVSTALLINAMRNVMCGVRNNKKYLRALNDIYVEKINSGSPGADYPLASEIISQAIACIADEDLDGPLISTGAGKSMA